MVLEHLRVKGHPQIEDVDLTDLARINVVAGKNNSGKTTLLKAICGGEHAYPGLTLTDDHLTDLTRRARERYPDLRNPHLPRHFTTALGAEKDARKILWFDELAEFAQSVIHRLRAYAGTSVHWSEGPLVGCAKEFFPEVRGTLLPPTRTLEYSPKIETNHKGNPDGKGVLNHLFAWKNSAVGSEEWERYSRLKKTFQTISEGYSFDIIAGENNTIHLHFSTDRRKWTPGYKFGLGLSDLLVILYFVELPDPLFLAIEEPETHMHPAMQRRLLAHLKSQTQGAFFISTHSNVFLDPTYVGKVITTTFDGKVRPEDMTSRAFVLSDLGYSIADNLVSDHLILCEGPSDVAVIREFLAKMGVLDKYNIKVLPLGGDIMDQVDLSVFVERAHVSALIDKDPGSSKVRARFRKACEEHGIPLHVLKRYSIENYFTLAAIHRVFGDQVPSELARIDPRTKVSSQLGFDIKKSNRKIAREMDLSDIDDTDLKEFLDRIAQDCEKDASTRSENE